MARRGGFVRLLPSLAFGTLLLAFVAAVFLQYRGYTAGVPRKEPAEPPAMAAEDETQVPFQTYLRGPHILLPRDQWYAKWVDSFFSPRQGWEYSPYISPGTKTYIYCAIPRNGCTQQKYLMLLLMGRASMPVHQLPEEDEYSRIVNAPPEIGQDLIFDESIPKFVIVRNPVMRTLSAFVDKIINHGDSELYAKYPKTFPEFVEKHLAGIPASASPATYCRTFRAREQHWRPQICSCGMEHAPDLFHQFQFEHPEPLVSFLYESIPSKHLDTGWGAARNLSLRESFVGEHSAYQRAASDDLFLKYCDRTTFELLSSVLEPDITSFGYQDEISRLGDLLLAKTSIQTEPHTPTNSTIVEEAH